MVRAKTKTRKIRSIPRIDGGPKTLSRFINEGWVDELPEASVKVQEEFVYGSADEDFESDWDVLPTWEKFVKPQKKNSKKSPTESTSGYVSSAVG